MGDAVDSAARTRRKPPTASMMRTLALIDWCGIYAYVPDGHDAPDLPLVAILNDLDHTPLPVRDVRGLLTRGLVMAVWEDEFPIGLVLSDAGRRLLITGPPQTGARAGDSASRE